MGEATVMEPYPKLLLSAKDRGGKKAQLRSCENVQSIKSTATDVVSLLHDDESSHGPVMDYCFFSWCENSRLSLNVSKTKMCIEFRGHVPPAQCTHIDS